MTPTQKQLESALVRLTGLSTAELEAVVQNSAGLPRRRAMYQVAMALLGRGHIPSLSL